MPQGTWLWKIRDRVQVNHRKWSNSWKSCKVLSFGVLARVSKKMAIPENFILQNIAICPKFECQKSDVPNFRQLKPFNILTQIENIHSMFVMHFLFHFKDINPSIQISSGTIDLSNRNKCGATIFACSIDSHYLISELNSEWNNESLLPISKQIARLNITLHIFINVKISIIPLQSQRIHFQTQWQLKKSKFPTASSTVCSHIWETKRNGVDVAAFKWKTSMFTFPSLKCQIQTKRWIIEEFDDA